MKIIIKLISFLMMVYGISYIFIYINLFSFGYNIKEYLNFILKRYECYLFLLGLIIQLYYIIRKG